MKCEKCGNELIGSAIICRKCNHNNARQRVAQWRESRGVTSRSTARTAPLNNSVTSPLQNTLPLEMETKPVDDANLVRFPHDPTHKQSHLSTLDIEPELSEYPPWRAQLKEKVRLAREKRLAQNPQPIVRHDEVDLDPNPLVEAALKRIRKTSTTPLVTRNTNAIRQSMPAAAQAETLELDRRPKADTSGYKPVVRQSPRPPARPSEQPAKLADTVKPVVTRSETKTEIKVENKTDIKVGTKTPTPKPILDVKTDLKADNKSDSKADTKVKTDVKTPTVVTADAGAKITEPPPKIELKEPQLEQTEPPPFLVFAMPSGKGGFVETEIIEIPLTVSDVPDTTAKSASLWTRTLAGACDFEIISMAFLPIFAAYATLNTSLGNEAIFILLMILSATTFVYQAVTLTLADRTFGMALLNTHLINTDDESTPITKRQMLLRAWAASIAFLFPPLNFVVMQLNRRHFSLPDLISGTSPTEK